MKGSDTVDNESSRPLVDLFHRRFHSPQGILHSVDGAMCSDRRVFHTHVILSHLGVFIWI